MGALNRFVAILVADLRERSRSGRFWLMLGTVAAFTWWCFPPIEAGYMTVSLGAGVRAHYSSAWIGMVLGLMYSTMMSLFGFYLVRGNLVRDFDTRVWQLLVATPMTRRAYLLAKWASHMTVFLLFLIVGLLVGAIAQVWRGEDPHLDLIELVKPALWLSLPALAVTAMFAVLFDLVPWTRRTGGNVLYFFVWITLFTVTFLVLNPEEVAWARTTWLSDPNGLALVLRDLQAHLSVAQPGTVIHGMNIGSSSFEGGAKLFEWTQWTLRPMDLLGRLLWPLLSVLAVMAMSPWLDWAAARTRTAATSAADRPGRRLRWLDALLRPIERFPLGVLVAAELRLVLRQRRRLWWLAIMVLAAIQTFGSLPAIAIACIGAWLISIDVFSRAVLREHEQATGALMYTAAGARSRLLRSRVVVATMMAVVPVVPALVRLSSARPEAATATLLVALSIAIGGLAVGALCRNGRPFELLLVLFAYIGIQGQSTLNAVIDPASTAAQHALLLPALAVLLIGLWPRFTRVR